MNKTLRLIALGFCILSIAILARRSEARLTGTNPTGSSADAWCVGKSGAETCIDYQGSVIPTTSASQTLGSSSLKFSSGSFSGSVTADDIIAGDISGSRLHTPWVTSITTVTLLTTSPTAAGDVVNVFNGGTGTFWSQCISTGTGAGAWVWISSYSVSGVSTTAVPCRQGP